MVFSADDEKFMRRALVLAEEASNQEEVPVGAVIVLDNQIIAEGYNSPIKDHDASAHAEIVVLRQAGKIVSNYRLVGTTMYVTLEPCAMCAAALIHARIDRLVFGAYDPKTGACGSVINILEEKTFNHRINYQGGLLEDDCSRLLKDFFKRRRITVSANNEKSLVAEELSE